MDARWSIWPKFTAAVRLLAGQIVNRGTVSRAGMQGHRRLSDWADTELYSVWCATGTELLKAAHAEDTDHLLTAAEARQHLLTEIEHRHPRETAAWLTSDAILSGEPPTFLVR